MRMRFWLLGCLLPLAACLDPNPTPETEMENPWIPYTELAANSAVGDIPPTPGAPTPANCAETPMTDWACLKLPPGLPPMAANWPGATKGFATLCARCHNFDGKGSEQGRQLGAKDLSSDAVQGLSDAQLTEAIKNGSKNQKMPAFGDSLSDSLIQELVKHVRSLPSKKLQAPF